MSDSIDDITTDRVDADTVDATDTVNTTDTAEDTTARRRRPRRRVPEIPLPDGDRLIPRAVLAEEKLRVCERTLKRWRLPTTYIGGVAYNPLNASLQIIADTVRRPNEPPKRRRRSRP